MNRKHSLKAQSYFFLAFAFQGYFLILSLLNWNKIVREGLPIDGLAVYSILSVPLIITAIIGFYKWKKWSIYLAAGNVLFVPFAILLISLYYFNFYQNPKFVENPIYYTFNNRTLLLTLIVIPVFYYFVKEIKKEWKYYS